MTPKNLEIRPVILAAGVGKRLQPLTNEMPKCLLQINKENTILDLLLKNIESFFTKKSIIVIGKENSSLGQKTIQSFKDRGSKVVVNPYNIRYENLYSLFLAIKNIKEEQALFLDGDIVFNKEILNSVMSKGNLILCTNRTSNKEKGGRTLVDKKKLLAIREKIDEDKDFFIYAGIMKLERNIMDKILMSCQTGDFEKKIVDIINKYREDFLVKIFNRYNGKGTMNWININYFDDYYNAKKFYG